MIRAAGSFLILCGACAGLTLQARERRRRTETLRGMTEALRRLAEEIRMTRMPFPRLMENLSAAFGGETGRCFARMAAGLRAGGSPQELWRRETEGLPLPEEDKRTLQELEWQGDEEKICNGIYLVISCLTRSLETQRQNALQESKRSTALWISGGVLLVILLI